MVATKIKEPLNAEKVIDIVQDFIDDELGNMISVGQPCHVISGLQSAWAVPLVLTSPGYGIVGIVGTVLVDSAFGHIIGWTPLDEVRANAESLTDDKEADLDFAFQALRTPYLSAAN